ncbi:ribonuclease HII [Cellulomonas sp. APG4]|uniref:ribonuclease HII n=1 Tax=Cellulomonas sp. APG4 TaxID=1538656 RepID=UPI001379B0EB|nr:ribonuclease HII [Cellulomonas sp. APG4]NCT92242.1 ribonuclease HII [Cellulomonas sp. APG4]
MTASRPRPHLRHERALLRQGARVVVGMDEVGRGALAGPVSVGAVAVDLGTRTCPAGVADSKLLTPAARERLRPALSRWGLARAVGHAGPDEIDRFGIIAALRLAGMRALAALGVEVDLVLLDGTHDWLSPPAQPSLFEELAVGPDALPVPDGVHVPRVVVRVKADRTCASVAAASVLAKCERDALMVQHAAQHPAYGWADNKGYGSGDHVQALRDLGPCGLHRRSWRLPLVGGTAADAVGPDAASPPVGEPAQSAGSAGSVVSSTSSSVRATAAPVLVTSVGTT